AGFAAILEGAQDAELRHEAESRATGRAAVLFATDAGMAMGTGKYLHCSRSRRQAEAFVRRPGAAARGPSVIDDVERQHFGEGGCREFPDQPGQVASQVAGALAELDVQFETTLRRPGSQREASVAHLEVQLVTRSVRVARRRPDFGRGRMLLEAAVERHMAQGPPRGGLVAEGWRARTAAAQDGVDVDQGDGWIRQAAPGKLRRGASAMAICVPCLLVVLLLVLAQAVVERLGTDPEHRRRLLAHAAAGGRAGLDQAAFHI